MVRLFLLSLLTVYASVVLAAPNEEQRVLGDSTAHLSSKWSYTDCGTENDLIKINSIELSPDPPKPGRNLTVTVSGTADEIIEEGAYADVVVKLGLIKLLSRQFDICEEARSANVSLQCPVERGDHVVSHTVTLPREIPQAKFGVNVHGYTNEDRDMFCLNLVVDFSPFSFPRVW